jgi:hypothetical protein
MISSFQTRCLMQKIVYATVEKPETPPTAFPVFPQLSEPTFSQLLAEAKRLGINDSRPNQDMLISIRTFAGNPAVQAIFDRLHELGWDVAHRFISRSKRKKQERKGSVLTIDTPTLVSHD